MEGPNEKAETNGVLTQHTVVPAIDAIIDS